MELNGYWLEIIFGLISALIFWIIHYLQAEIKKYKKLLDEKEDEATKNLIAESLAPIEESLTSINQQIGNIKKQNIKYYGTLLSHDCQYYLNKGFITEKEFNKTSEILHIYEGLGGDGHIHDLWQKVIVLPLKDE